MTTLGYNVYFAVRPTTEIGTYMEIEFSPASFIGLGSHIEYGHLAFPFGPIDIFGLSTYKKFPFYPWPTNSLVWVVLVHKSVFDVPDKILRFDIKSDDGSEVGHFELSIDKGTDKSDEAIPVPEAVDMKDRGGIVASYHLEWHMIPVQINGSIQKPGDYFIFATRDEKEHLIGKVIFDYEKSDPLSLEEMQAIKADPNSMSGLRVIASCNECGDSLKAYAATERSGDSESEGFIWQHDLPDSYKCSCGKQQHDLSYIKGGLHAPMRNASLDIKGGLSYTRRYSHDQILKVVTRYNSLIESERNENPIQRFIEENLVLLSQFHGTKIFVKPSILGKFEADFAVLTVKGELVFIELEAPSMKLFKKDGHQSAKLTHAYGQVLDWLDEYRKHSSAILERMGVEEKKVLSFKGAVIAGLSKNESHEALQKHMMSRAYQHIDLYTLDDLTTSLVQISRDLA